ncbi:MAG: phosphatase PAP2 family protein, partial [Pontibacterium sp.]
YLPPLMPGEQGVGKSFPSGHASAGFAFYIFYFLLRHRNQRRALMALAAATALGLTFGMGRAVAGGHFISDTLWAGYFMFLASWLVYYPIMNMRKREERLATGYVAPPMSLKQKAGISLAVCAVLVSSLMAKPHTKSASYAPSASDLNQVAKPLLHFDFATANIYVDPKVETFSMNLETKGFGFPNNKLKSTLTKTSDAWEYNYEHLGFFTEKGTVVELRINPQWLDRVEIQLDSGRLFLSQGMQPNQVNFKGEGELIIAE